MAVYAAVGLLLTSLCISSSVVLTTKSSNVVVTITEKSDCPLSQVVLLDKNKTIESPGEYEIDKDSYRMKVWPPVTIEAIGPGRRDYQKTVYSEPCNVQNLILDRDKNYTRLVLK
jgi:hypothetical protein